MLQFAILIILLAGFVFISSMRLDVKITDLEKKKITYSKPSEGRNMLLIFLLISFVFVMILSFKDFSSYTDEYKRIETIYLANEDFKKYIEEKDLIEIGVYDNHFTFNDYDYFLMERFIKKNNIIEKAYKKYDISNFNDLVLSVDIKADKIEDYYLSTFNKSVLVEDVLIYFKRDNSISEYEYILLEKKYEELPTENNNFLYEIKKIYNLSELPLLEKALSKNFIKRNEVKILENEFHLFLSKKFKGYGNIDNYSHNLADFIKEKSWLYENIYIKNNKDERVIKLLNIIKEDNFTSYGEYELLYNLFDKIKTEVFLESEAGIYVQKYAKLAIEKNYKGSKSIKEEIKRFGFVSYGFKDTLEKIYKENNEVYADKSPYDFESFEKELIKIEEGKKPLEAGDTFFDFRKLYITEENKEYFSKVFEEIETFGFIRKNKEYKFNKIGEKYIEDVLYKGYEADAYFLYKFTWKSNKIHRIKNYEKEYGNDERYIKLIKLINKNNFFSIGEFDILEELISTIKLERYRNSKGNKYIQQAGKFAIDNKFEDLDKIETELETYGFIRNKFKEELKNIFNENIEGLNMSLFSDFEELFKEISNYKINSLKKFYLKGCEPAIFEFNKQKEYYGVVSEEVKEKVENKYIEECYN